MCFPPNGYYLQNKKAKRISQWVASEAPLPLGEGLDAVIVDKLFFNRLNIRNNIVYLHRETYSTDKTQS